MENQTKTTLTLNPEEEKQSNILLEGAPVRQTVQPIVQTQTEYNAGSIDESMLSNDEKEMVAQFANEIDISNAKQVIQYGSSAQKSISDFSVNILGKVKTSELGDVGDALKELTVALDATTEPEKKGILGIFQKAKRGVDSIKANYAKAETNVSRIEKDLEKHQVVLTQDVEMFEQMYDLNLQYYRELTMYIIAGKKALDKARGEQLEALKVKAETSQMQEDVENYNKYVNLCNRFEKKLHDLELTRVIAMQVAPQIRLLQDNDQEMLEKIQSSLVNTIPLWRHQMVLALGIEHTQRALSAQNMITEKTNELLTRNAETLKMATVETAKEAERSVVDIATLKRCNQQLISSISEVVKIHEQGAKRRQDAETELVKVEQELKQALLEAGSK
ncbi:toxic anion resistance protein [Lachnospira rogosae (ex Hitch et al. 2025)]|uniref:Toxic anion resistance protein n=1 Tax=[Lactobacillus] rogosae TaxID=706562 RepID=A0ABV1BZM6_9FIRM